MRLTSQDIKHINTITHDGKVLVFGTGHDGTVFYAAKRAGFEDSAMQAGAEPFGFEDWRPLRLGESLPDESVHAHEREHLSDANGVMIMRTIYGDSDEIVKSADAPVQLVSALDHVYVFRQSPGGNLLVSRFVLDGMSNELIPKLEVRYQRSRKRLEPQETKVSASQESFDSLDYRDIDGAPFYEGSIELSFLGKLNSGWFSPVFTPTMESDRFRWHIFAYEPATSTLVLYTVGSSSLSPFDVKDYLFARPNRSQKHGSELRPIPGIIKRTIALNGLTVAGGPSATTYDLQREQYSPTGPQLLRDRVRLMLAVPIRGNDSATKTAILDFSLSSDGTLSQVERVADQHNVLRNDEREVIPPLTLLEEVEEIAQTEPPPAGIVTATVRGEKDLLRVRSDAALPAGVKVGVKVRLRGTQSYDGPYKVLSVDEKGFVVAAPFKNDEKGFWEVIPARESGFVFENMVVGTAKTADGKLRVACPSHNVRIGDHIQISGTEIYDGVFPVKSVPESGASFTLDTPYFAGRAGNLSRIVRRGLVLNGDDWVHTPELELLPTRRDFDTGRTLSAWVKVNKANRGTIARDSGSLTSLFLDAKGKATFWVRMSNMEAVMVRDPSPAPPGKWVHYSASFEYQASRGGVSRFLLHRNGVRVAAQVVPPNMPVHLRGRPLALNGVDAFLGVQKFSSPRRAITVSAWARSAKATWSAHGALVSKRNAFILSSTLNSKAVTFYIFVPNTGWKGLKFIPKGDIRQWHYYTGTYDGRELKLYIDGREVGSKVVASATVPGGVNADTKNMRIGGDTGYDDRLLHGWMAGVELWDRALTSDEIGAHMGTRLTGEEAGLIGYWPLDDGSVADRSTHKHHTIARGGAKFVNMRYVYPRSAPPIASDSLAPRAMRFDGVNDHVEVPKYVSPKNAITVSVWARSATSEWSNSGCLVSQRSSCVIFPVRGKRSIRFYLWIGGKAKYLSFTPGDITIWRHYAMTYDGKTLRCFVNGKQKGVKAVTGKIDPATSMFIGRDGYTKAGERRFAGELAHVTVWSQARTAAQLTADMFELPAGDENHLVGYWPLTDNAEDLSKRRRTGVADGEPIPVITGSDHYIGQGFEGHLSEVQIWDRARSADEVKRTMHLHATGDEDRLAAYYRMGATLFPEAVGGAGEDARPRMPDFSKFGRDALVYGDPHHSARRLNRATSSGQKVVKYGHDGMVAVGQRALYEESFEFRVFSPNNAFDPNNTDKLGSKLFRFAYWGKNSRGSKERILFPTDAARQSKFMLLPNGWYKATCQVRVPDGVSLMRAFELADVRGLWRAQKSPPVKEWTSIAVRKHRIRVLSNSVTEVRYTDKLTLAALPAQSQATLHKLDQVRAAERGVSRIEGEIQGLEATLDVARNLLRYSQERRDLEIQVVDLRAKRVKTEKVLEGLPKDDANYYYRFSARHSGKFATMLAQDGYYRLIQAGFSSSDEQLFMITKPEDLPKEFSGHLGKITLDPGLRCLIPKVRIADPFSGPLILVRGKSFIATHTSIDDEEATRRMLWRFDPSSSAGFWTVRSHFDDEVWDVHKESSDDGAKIQWYHEKGIDAQKFTRDRTDELHIIAKARLKSETAVLEALVADIAKLELRLEWLVGLLSKFGDQVSTDAQIAAWEAQLVAARAKLSSARNTLATRDQSFLDGLTQAPPAYMPRLALDTRERATHGAILDFAQPSGDVQLFESLEGNVLLNYFDTRGRIRSTQYDAVADTRNQTYEQWLPDGARACVDIRGSGHAALTDTVPVPASGWTCEAWIQYPPAAMEDGSAYPSNVIAATADVEAQDALLMLRNGSRLGVLMDGWFFDGGVALEDRLGFGWHHVAVTCDGMAITFYLDGVEVGARPSNQPALRFNGATDYVEIPAHDNPTDTLSISVWARSDGPTWNATSALLSKRDAFLLEPVADTREIRFTLMLSGAESRVLAHTVDDIQQWHHYSATFDGERISLYVDSKLVDELKLEDQTAVNLDKETMLIGRAHGRDLFFKGDIAEVAVWRGLRLMNQVAEDMRQSPRGDEDELFGFWPMQRVRDPDAEGAGASADYQIQDTTQDARHGLVHGAPIVANATTSRALEVARIGNDALGRSPIGRLSEVRLWSLPLSKDEVATHATARASGGEPGLLSSWSFDEGQGQTAYDRTSAAPAHATLKNAKWAGCTADQGNPGSSVLGFMPHFQSYVTLPGPQLAHKSFTIECWARRGSAKAGAHHWLASMGTGAAGASLHVGFRASGVFAFTFRGDGLDTSNKYMDLDWHHWCCTYDSATRKRVIYRDGVKVAANTAAADFKGSGDLYLGRGLDDGFLHGELVELRIWSSARTRNDIRANMRRRLSGVEPGLLAYYPLDRMDPQHRLLEAVSGHYQGALTGDMRMLSSSSLPIAGGGALVTCEFSTTGVNSAGKTQAVLRRFLGFADGGDAHLLSEQLLEELVIQWIGNTQLAPSLLGYIEGAPPVPSENFTRDEEYDEATTVTLTHSEETNYTWNRSHSSGWGMHTEGFAGLAWSNLVGGPFALMKGSEGQLGGVWDYTYDRGKERQSVVSAASTLTAIDSLTLTGALEDKVACPLVGKRWLPKNVGYALVVSGMADVFATRLARSGRMVSYDIRPVEGAPLDVNTITFMINPAYTANGSLDGMVGSTAAHRVYYPQVPAMRAQYGSHYPASYFRLREAYKLQEKIERQDKERETLFFNFHADELSRSAGSIGEWGSKMDSPEAGEVKIDNAAEMDDYRAEQAKKKEELEDEAERRRGQIATLREALGERTRANAAFDEWQFRMENVLRKAGKRNIVNTYVWDADGGLHAEEQGFADTVEHSFNYEISHDSGGGLMTEFFNVAFKVTASLVGTGRKSDSRGQVLSQSKALELNVDLSGVENIGITDLNDNPLVPGEKVSRYRFKTFYLEGSTDNFLDFFTQVVDPEWLESNSEEARALRQTRGARPTRPWRVMHRVTYVERPALALAGRDTRSFIAVAEESATLGFKTLTQRIDHLEQLLHKILNGLP